MTIGPTNGRDRVGRCTATGTIARRWPGRIALPPHRSARRRRSGGRRPRPPRDADRRRRLLYMLAAAGVIGLAVVLGVVFLAGGGDDDLASTMQDAGCQLKTVPARVETTARARRDLQPEVEHGSADEVGRTIPSPPSTASTTRR